MLVFIPILAMLALEFIIPGKQKITIKALLITLALFLLLLVSFRSSISDDWIYPEADAVIHVRAQVHRLLEKKDWQKNPVIILEGSSATEYGINGEALEKNLLEQGFPVTVLQLSLPGANHFERLWMLKLFFEKIGPRHCQELEHAPTILLSEVFDAYDQDPLYLFKKEAYSLRAIAWSVPLLMLSAWKSCHEYGWILYEHFLLNRFAVGIFSGMQVPHYQKKAGMFSPLSGTKKTFAYPAAQKAFEEGTRLYTSEPKSDLAAPSLGWSLYYQELQRTIKGNVSITGFYALPTLEVQRRAYQIAFTKVRPEGTIMLGPPSLLFMKNLNHESFWFDGVHPQFHGSVLFTEWLASEIAKKRPEIMSTLQQRTH